MAQFTLCRESQIETMCLQLHLCLDTKLECYFFSLLLEYMNSHNVVSSGDSSGSSSDTLVDFY